MEFTIFVIIEVMGFLAGGLIADVQGKGFHPGCWWGLLLTTGLYAIFKCGLFSVIGDIFD